MNRHFAARKTAHVLGFAGLIPFVCLSLGCWLVHPDWLPVLVSGQMAYGVAILAFLGGLHWGAALLSNDLSAERTKVALLWGVTPSLIGVGAAQLLIGIGFALITAAFVMVYLIDRRLYAWYRMPEWMLALRFKLTCVVVAALVLTFVAVNLRS
jgi:hypothetical protein